MRTRPLVTVAVAVAALICAVDPGLAEALEWRRAGEFWRAATCHLAHFGPSHLAFDVLAWLVLGVVCERDDRRAMVVTLGAAAAAIPLAVAVAEPTITSYRGLSGLDSALFGLAVTTRLQRRGGARWLLLAALFAVKLAVEASSGAVFVDDEAARVVPVAHVVGAAIGGLVAWGLPALGALRDGENADGAAGSTPA